MSEFLSKVESFMRRHGMGPTRFGLLALNDGAFVLSLRRGRNVRVDTLARVTDWMGDYAAANRLARSKAKPKANPKSGRKAKPSPPRRRQRNSSSASVT